ncbi:fructose-bisphosphatase class III [Hutsoniella sourekii]|uniref:fructose-bisphosphatase class III n=1 Tax=Hutsoniella sourekii TaxID=87650 RepID=UPI000486DE50|nr:fructose-bisphosphatase class III [Hutsoniella sourekii]
MNDKYYALLKEKFPTKESVLTEIINLEAIMQLPKGTEHFVSDLHGEFLPFNHVLRNGSGSIKQKVMDCFEGRLDEIDVEDLCVLIYYPTDKLRLEARDQKPEDLEAWYRQRIQWLLEVTNFAGTKYTRSKVRKSLPQQYMYIIEELLSEINPTVNKQGYFQSIMDKIIEYKQAPTLIRYLAITIQKLTVDHLHVVGDIYDRGPAPDLIMDRLMAVDSVDIQWGNHDITWMACLAGSKVSMMNVIRISARYANLDTIEDAYGINIRPLIQYALKYYEPLETFQPRYDASCQMSQHEIDILNRVQQATMILQLKLEGQIYQRRPEFRMKDRDLLSQVNYQDWTIELAGKVHPLVDFQAPTVDPADPLALTEEEVDLLDKLMRAFQASEKLTRHVNFLLDNGAMYLVYNNNLLIHGCIPMHDNGDFKSLRINMVSYAGKDLLDFYQDHIFKSFQDRGQGEDFSTDLLWYLWCGETSSLYGKAGMKTFERYYIEDLATHQEPKNAYYHLRNNESNCLDILNEFGLDETAHIINGHTPVKAKDGESPVKAGGRLIVIDGGFSKAYQSTTGIAGYTLVSNSHGMQLVAHHDFSSQEDAVANKKDVVSLRRLVDRVDNRTLVKETTIGDRLAKEIEDLNFLYMNYEKY